MSDLLHTDFALICDASGWSISDTSQDGHYRFEGPSEVEKAARRRQVALAQAEQGEKKERDRRTVTPCATHGAQQFDDEARTQLVLRARS